MLPDEEGWQAVLAPGGSTDRTFAIVNPEGTPVYTARLARVGLEGWLRREEAVLRELAADDSRWSPRQVTRIDASGDLTAELLVHEHIPGSNAPAGEVSVAAREQLGEALAWLHRHERDRYMIWPSLDRHAGTRADAFRARIASLRRYRSVGTHPQAESRIAALEAQAADLAPENGWLDPTFALLHGDLSPGNILWQPNADDVRLIDWEFSRDGDPAEDLAYLIAEGKLTPETFSDVAEGYIAGGGEPWALARVPAWLPLVALDAELWWADWST
jgi:aminoglycoside phosphotransferase (APT) family kinase protein